MVDVESATLVKVMSLASMRFAIVDLFDARHVAVAQEFDP